MRYYHCIFLAQLPLSIIPLFLIFTLDTSIIKEYANQFAILGLTGILSGVTIPFTIFILPNIDRKNKAFNSFSNIKDKK